MGLVERDLLGSDLLEEFMQKRPKTKDEWFRKIPEQMRTGVDSKQVGKYLGRVLEIIGEYAPCRPATSPRRLMDMTILRSDIERAGGG